MRKAINLIIMIMILSSSPAAATPMKPVANPSQYLNQYIFEDGLFWDEDPHEAADWKALAPLIKNSPKKIKTIKINIDEAGMIILAPNLPPDLERLYLNNSKIGDKGATALAEFLKNSSMTHIVLSNNNIGNKGGLAIFNNLPPSLTYLSFTGNNITPKGAIDLVQNLPPSLTRLILEVHKITPDEKNTLLGIMKIHPKLKITFK